MAYQRRPVLTQSVLLYLICTDLILLKGQFVLLTTIFAIHQRWHHPIKYSPRSNDSLQAIKSSLYKPWQKGL